MKNLIGFFIVLLLMVGCSDDQVNDFNSFEEDTSITTLNGTWKVVSFEDLENNTVEFKTEENSWGYDIIITFDDSQDPHSIAGKNTTNSVSGDFDYIASRQIKVNRLVSTRVGQPEWGNKFSQALGEGDISFIVNAKKLRFLYDDGGKSITFSKE